MKTSKYQKRFYRDWVNAKDIFKVRVALKETDLQVLTDKPIDKSFVTECIKKYRYDIEKYITKDQRFLTSLKPISVEMKSPSIIKEMSYAAKKANVGPMAAVAGAIADKLGKTLLRQGCKDVIVENGGDIFLKSSKVRSVKIYTGKAKAWGALSLKIQPHKKSLGICTSSGTVGHSLSFGCADAVVIIASNATLSDAVATATCNRVKSVKDFPSAINLTRSIKGVMGAVIILKNKLASWGDFELTRDNVIAK